jgi:hypothetical protein
MFAEADHDARADMMISAAAAEAALSMPSDTELQMALEFANAHEAAGNYGDAEAAVADYGIELASPADWSADAALADSMTRQAVAAAAGPAPRRDEDRLAWLLGQIGDGSYLPGDAGQAWPGEPSSLTNQPNCGLTDPETNLCTARYHEHGCGSIASTDVGLGLQQAGVLDRAVRQAAIDHDGRTWQRSDGGLATWGDVLEQITGQRLVSRPGDLFEKGPGARREVTSLRRQEVIKDWSDPDDGGTDAPPAARTQALAKRVAEQAGLASSAPADRARAVAEHNRRLADQGMWTSPRTPWRPRMLGQLRPGRSPPQPGRWPCRPRLGLLVRPGRGIRRTGIQPS